jgi:hypothetical protein
MAAARSSRPAATSSEPPASGRSTMWLTRSRVPSSSRRFLSNVSAIAAAVICGRTNFSSAISSATCASRSPGVRPPAARKSSNASPRAATCSLSRATAASISAAVARIPSRSSSVRRIRSSTSCSRIAASARCRCCSSAVATIPSRRTTLSRSTRRTTAEPQRAMTSVSWAQASVAASPSNTPARRGTRLVQGMRFTGSGNAAVRHRKVGATNPPSLPHRTGPQKPACPRRAVGERRAPGTQSFPSARGRRRDPATT